MVGHKAKLHHAKRHAEKVQLKKTLKAHDERNVKQKDDGAVKEGALPTYLLDREGQKVGITKVRLIPGCESALICSQRSPQGPCGQVRCTAAQGPRYRRGGDVQGRQDRKAQEQELEANGQQGDIRRRGVHTETCQAGGELNFWQS